MFNSKAFCIVIVLTTIALVVAIYLQVQEMMEYDLLSKLDKQYLSGTFSGDGDAAEPVADAESKKDDTADTAKKDDKK
ncbi:MAG: hypothetical protein KOO69_03000 [Victivallales bacterium]|nr:hypothetical protein [Victivallales bacterium]